MNKTPGGVLGVEVSGDAVRVARARRDPYGAALLSYCEQELPPDALRFGEPRQPTVVAEALRRAFDLAGARRQDVVVAGLDRDVTQLRFRRVDLPDLADLDLARTLPYQVDIAIRDA